MTGQGQAIFLFSYFDVVEWTQNAQMHRAITQFKISLLVNHIFSNLNYTCAELLQSS